uniref:DYW domain-containing protein n=1 Tax=Aegilops tauschii subsp. strangulata TaxID=200361 RepID=A0A453EZS7_AEGTS
MNRKLPPFPHLTLRFSSSSSSSSASPSPPPPRRLPPPVPLRDLLAHRLPLLHSPAPPPRSSPPVHPHADLLLRRRSGEATPESLHLELVKRGLTHDLFLSNHLVNSYAKSSRLACARQVFDCMLERNAVSWTCLVSGYVLSGITDEAFRVFRAMLGVGSECSRPTSFTFGSVLRACQDAGPDKLGFAVQVHGLVSKTVYASNTTVCNALISMYGNCSVGLPIQAQQVFDSTPVRDIITWNALMSVYAKKGHVVSTFTLFTAMLRDDSAIELRPNEHTFGSLITATTVSSCSSRVLEQVLARVLNSGSSGDLYVGSALVSAFARHGMLDEAKNIFLSLKERNAVTLNGLIVGLVKQHCSEEAVGIFMGTRDSVVVNADTYVVLLGAIAEFSVPEDGLMKGTELHGHVLRTGLIDLKIAISNSLVNMYAKCGAIDKACRVFQLLCTRDRVSWNTIISVLDQNGLRLLSAGQQVHCDAVKWGLDLDTSVSNALVKMYGECGARFECWEVFNSMAEHDVVSWNSIMGVMANLRAPIAESVEVFSKMMRSGLAPNKVTFVNLLATLSPSCVLELGKQVHAVVLKHGAIEDTAVDNALMSCYAKSGDMDSCEQLFSEISGRRDAVSWNSMISGYIYNGHLQEAIDSVWLMMHSDQVMDCCTFSIVLNACASVAALERGMEMHAFGIRSQLESDVVVESALVDMYSKCGKIGYASKVFSSMNQKNEFSWNSMISGYARHGLGRKALEIFEEMQQSGANPDHVTFITVLSACSHAGLVDRGLEYFEMMEDHGILPQIEHYSCVIDLLGRAGKLMKIREYIRRMPMKPNTLIWRTVLVACRQSKDRDKIDMGLEASRMLLELEPQNPVNYVLASNFYAATGRWEDTAKTRAAMGGAGVKKEAGRSWVTLGDGVHTFIAGDRSHPNTKEIYEKLSVLIQKIRNAGYVPMTEFALYDLEEENKEELLNYHSEKLAVAFVL